MDDLSQKTIMFIKKVPPKIVKKTFHINYPKNHRIAINLEFIIKIINFIKK